MSSMGMGGMGQMSQSPPGLQLRPPLGSGRGLGQPPGMGMGMGGFSSGGGGGGNLQSPLSQSQFGSMSGSPPNPAAAAVGMYGAAPYTSMAPPTCDSPLGSNVNGNGGSPVSSQMPCSMQDATTGAWKGNSIDLLRRKALEHTASMTSYR